jgi:hypothetical protein
MTQCHASRLPHTDNGDQGHRTYLQALGPAMDRAVAWAWTCRAPGCRCVMSQIRMDDDVRVGCCSDDIA